MARRTSVQRGLVWRSEVLVRFNHLASADQAYMAHCHLLEHEDTGMMLGFTVAD